MGCHFFGKGISVVEELTTIEGRGHLHNQQSGIPRQNVQLSNAQQQQSLQIV